MNFFKKLFGGGDKAEQESTQPTWIGASENPWGIELLDVRPITHRSLSVTSDPQMAANAVSYRGDDGASFFDEEPESQREISADLIFSVNPPFLAPGVLFTPKEMEHRWAIFYHQSKIIFVRSWLRKVMVTATTSQQGGRLHIEKITGHFGGDEVETPDFTRAIVKFLLISHVTGRTFPAPLPPLLSTDLKDAGLWAMSMYGNMASVGTFSLNFAGSTDAPLRSYSVLHIAVAQNNLNEIDRWVKNGIPIDLLGADGNSPLHWSIAAEGLQAMQRLIDLGADLNVLSSGDATPLMEAVQQNSLPHVNLLISSGANVNARDHRKSTALHRAAEIGNIGIVRALLNNGAECEIEVEGYTPFSIAKMRGHKEIMRLLKK